MPATHGHLSQFPLNRLFLKLYVISVPIFFALDMVWLGVVAKDVYRAQIGTLLRPDVRWSAAIVFYLLFLAGLVFFVIEPAMQKHSWSDAMLRGAFFGLVAYATYDLTNLAVMKQWTVLVTVVDMVWGAILAAVVTGITFAIAQRIW